MFRVKINMTCLSMVYEIEPSPVNFIHDMCDFNPILDGADIRSYFDLFPLEIFSGNSDDITAVISECFYRSILVQLIWLAIEPRRSANE